jgi:hypothetical protein
MAQCGKNEKILSGEFFDLTITSRNNKFGEEKIYYSTKYGISLPIEKYIDELEMIKKNSQDDKSDKRENRLQFLQQCSGQPRIKQAFSIFCEIINGGGDEYRPVPDNLQATRQSRQYTNKVILTVAGGNIIILFAKLLQNIIAVDNIIFLTKTNKDIITELSFRIPNTTHENIFQDLQSQAQSMVLQSQAQSITSIKEIANNPLSDFDYNLLPNIGQLPPPNPSDKEGFVLMRVKSYVHCKAKPCEIETPLEIKKSKEDCYKRLKDQDGASELLSRLYPQMIQKSDENKVPPESECLKYIKWLLEKKKNIEMATRQNIDTVIDYYYYTQFKNKFPTPNQSNIVEIESAILYLSTVTENLNKYIKEWEKQNLNYKLDDFSSLEKITQSPLIELASGIIIQFLNSSIYKTEQILDKLALECPNYRFPPSMLTFISSDRDLTSALSRAKSILNLVRYSNYGFPDGINITINAIKTSSNQVSQQVPQQVAQQVPQQVPQPASGKTIEEYFDRLKRELGLDDENNKYKPDTDIKLGFTEKEMLELGLTDSDMQQLGFQKINDKSKFTPTLLEYTDEDMNELEDSDMQQLGFQKINDKSNFIPTLLEYTDDDMKELGLTAQDMLDLNLKRIKQHLPKDEKLTVDDEKDLESIGFTEKDIEDLKYILIKRKKEQQKRTKTGRSRSTRAYNPYAKARGKTKRRRRTRKSTLKLCKSTKRRQKICRELRRKKSKKEKAKGLKQQKTKKEKAKN